MYVLKCLWISTMPLLLVLYKRSVRVRVSVILVSLKAKNTIIAFTYNSYKNMKTISIDF